MKHGTLESLICEARARYIGEFISEGHSEAQAIAALGLKVETPNQKAILAEIRERVRWYDKKHGRAITKPSIDHNSSN